MRGAILVLGALGLSMCAFGASPSAYTTPGALTAIASLLDTGALILVVAGLYHRSAAGRRAPHG